MPAIHRNRAEIRTLFEHTIAQGQSLGNEASAIAEAARLHLRPKFLTVPVAVSGANFGIAETGAIGVVESEGNGRMCLTLPKVLVTIMGIEKVLPSWRDLEVFLQLLPRSSTAERMNPYTSLWTGVRPGDGPQEFHLILLDGGRTDVLADEVGRAGAALHPLLGLPERVPGLRARRRPGLRVRLSGPDRRDPDAAAATVWRRRRRCRGRRRCAARVTRSARSRSTSPRSSCTCAGGSCARRSRG